MKLTDLVKMCLGLQSRVDALENKPSVPAENQTQTPSEPEQTQTPSEPELSVDDFKQTIDALQNRVDEFEKSKQSAIDAAVLQKTTDLENSFQEKVKAEAALLQADFLAKQMTPPVQTGAKTNEEKTQLKGRARLTAAIKRDFQKA